MSTEHINSCDDFLKYAILAIHSIIEKINFRKYKICVEFNWVSFDSIIGRPLVSNANFLIYAKSENDAIQ